MVVPTGLHAIEAPEDDAPPPAEAVRPAEPASAFLGIVLDRIPQALREHLNLGEDGGLIISSIIPDSPAAKAGLGINDIITGIDGKKIATPEAFRETIGGHKPGDVVRIDSIRKGKAEEAKVTLGERPAHMPMARNMGVQDIPALEGMPDEIADRIRRMVEDNAKGFEILPEQPLPQAAPEIQGAMDEMRKKIEQMQGGMKLEFDLGKNGLQAQRQTSFRMMDKDGSVELKSENDAKEVTVRDLEGNVIWRGPWDTDQDKAAAPDDIRERIERLNINGAGAGGLRFNIRPQR